MMNLMKLLIEIIKEFLNNDYRLERVQIAQSYNNFAGVYGNLGRFDEVQLGPFHASTLFTKSCIGMMQL
jgi:hypothetical protein